MDKQHTRRRVPNHAKCFVFVFAAKSFDMFCDSYEGFFRRKEAVQFFCDSQYHQHHFSRTFLTNNLCVCEFFFPVPTPIILVNMGQKIYNDIYI